MPAGAAARTARSLRRRCGGRARRAAGRVVAFATGGVAALVLGVAVATAPRTAAAQPPPAPVRTVTGRVQLPATAESLRPAVGAWVTLHRVGRDSAGPLDSTRTGGEGRYAFRYRRAVGDSAVFFVSARWSGITYFSPPLPDRDVSGDDAALIVYDTTAGPLRPQLRGRHVIIGSLDSTRRHPVVEIFDLANDSTVTIVAGDSTPAWTTRLPAQAQDVRLTGGELSPDAVTVRDGQLAVFAPFAPGVKQLGFAYSLPPAAFPLALPIETSVPMMEVLVEDGAARVTGPTIEPVDTVQSSGRSFRRFVGRDVPASGTVRVMLPPPPADNRRLYLTVLVVGLGLLMLLALARAVGRRRAAPLLLPGTGLVAERDELARRIAALDAAYQRRRNPSEAERLEYERRRGGLRAMLGDALQQRADS